MKQGWQFLPLIASASILAAFAGAPTEVKAQAEFQLTMQSTWPAGDPHHLNFERWAEQVEKYTQGRVSIETLPAGTIVDAFEVLDAINDQIIDGGHAWSGYWIGKDRAAVMVSSGPAGPFGMDDIDYWGWQWKGGGREVNNWFFREHLGMNVEWFPAGSTGPQVLGWFNTELASADDLRGLTLRIPGIPGEMYEHMGVSVVTLPGGEILPAGERGVIDAAEYVGPYIDLRMGFHDVWQYVYAPAYHETVTVMEVMFNGDVWNSFPEDLQELIKLVTREHFLWWNQHQNKNRKISMGTLEEHGVEFRRTPDDILEESLEAWHHILLEEFRTNEAFRRIASSQLEWARNVVPARHMLDPDYKALAEVYWAPGGFLEQHAEELEVDWQAPEYFGAFAQQ
jgi:TRAP-type mannitol/chloroaromatic compound transport system substrate-binding protein